MTRREKNLSSTVGKIWRGEIEVYETDRGLCVDDGECLTIFEKGARLSPSWRRVADMYREAMVAAAQ